MARPSRRFFLPLKKWESDMQGSLERFDAYLTIRKGMAGNSRTAYCRDLLAFQRFLQEKGITHLEEAGNTEVVSYLLLLKQEGKTAATVNRRLASLRAYFRYLQSEEGATSDPTSRLRPPRIEAKHPEYLTVEEVETLLAAPDSSVKGRRDRALLELLYATGVRVSEAAAANVTDVNLRIGFLLSGGDHGKARIIPLGRPARAAVEAYIYEARPQLIRDRKGEETALFVNYNGERLTRQGIWKLLRSYAEQVGLAERLTPKTLRNSFAVHMLQNGADLRALQELLGHEDLAATSLYLSVAKSRIKDVYDKAHPRA